MRHKRNAFTLIELLVIIGIIGTLVALILPAVSNYRNTGGITKTYIVKYVTPEGKIYKTKEIESSSKPLILIDDGKMEIPWHNIQVPTGWLLEIEEKKQLAEKEVTVTLEK